MCCSAGMAAAFPGWDTVMLGSLYPPPSNTSHCANMPYINNAPSVREKKEKFFSVEEKNCGRNSQSDET